MLSCLRLHSRLKFPAPAQATQRPTPLRTTTNADPVSLHPTQRIQVDVTRRTQSHDMVAQLKPKYLPYAVACSPSKASTAMVDLPQVAGLAENLDARLASKEHLESQVTRHDLCHCAGEKRPGEKSQKPFLRHQRNQRSSHPH